MSHEQCVSYIGFVRKVSNVTTRKHNYIYKSKSSPRSAEPTCHPAYFETPNEYPIKTDSGAQSHTAMRCHLSPRPWSFSRPPNWAANQVPTGAAWRWNGTACFSHSWTYFFAVRLLFDRKSGCSRKIWLDGFLVVDEVVGICRHTRQW